jgi:uncharacterized protein (DUF1684 family)
MRNRIIVGFLLLAVLVVGYFSLNNSQLPDAKPMPKLNYAEEIAKYRSEKNEYLKTAKDSPVYEEDRLTFKGLRYFEPDTAFRVKAFVSKYETSIGIPIEMTHGKPEFYKPYGNAIFSIKGQECRLMLFKSEESQTIFVAFKDQTSNKESYGGGRYIEIPRKSLKNDSLVIDFNYCFNPFCNYNPTYSCPIPPKENNLPIAILAGEKRFSYLDK